MKIIKSWLLFSVILMYLISAACGKKSEVQVAEINVFAAASMTESLSSLAADYEKNQNGKVKVNLNFAGSQALETQIENGAKADIFISASSNYMDKLKDKGLVTEDKVLVKNRLAIIKNKSSGCVIKGIKDLAGSKLKLAIGDTTVPVGSYWEQAVAKAIEAGEIDEDNKRSIVRNTVTKELNVKDIVSKVLTGDADAGVVYKTDVTPESGEKLDLIDDPVFGTLEAVYPAGVIKASEGNVSVLGFMNFLFSEVGRKTFDKYGFITK